MDHRNGTAAAAFVGPPMSKGYVPRAYGYALDYNDQRPFFRLADVERMRRDPQIQFGLRVLRTPLYRLKFTPKANAPEVAAFGAKELKRLLRTCLPQFSQAFAWGYFAGEWRYRQSRKTGLVRCDGVVPFHALDVDPLVLDGKTVGVQLRGAGGGGPVRIGTPRACWLALDSEYDPHRGRSRLLNAWTPWMEKTGRHGALDIRRLWYLKNAYHGGVIRHPGASTELPDGTVRDDQDIARELIEKIETGGMLVMPNARDLAGKDYAWTLEPAEVNGTIEDIREYPKDLDREILIGMGVPPEVVQAAENQGLGGVGGRDVPAEVFYTSEDEVASAIVEAVVASCVLPMCRFNFGPEAFFEAELETLVPAPQPPPAPPVPGTPKGPGGDKPVPPQPKPPAAPAELSLVDTVAAEARRRYPAGGWVLTADGEWVRVPRSAALGFDADQPREDDGKWTEGAGGAKSDPAPKSGTVAKWTRRIAEKATAAEHAGAAALGWAAHKLPEKWQSRARAAWGLSMLTYTSAQKAAAHVARARGLTEQQTEHVVRLLAIGDLVGMKAFPAMLAASGFGAAAPVGSFVPVASSLYLGYSTARDPLAVLKAARAALGKSAELSDDEPEHLEREDLAGRLASGVAGAGGDWYLAVVSAAMDDTRDLAAALDLADETPAPAPETAELSAGGSHKFSCTTIRVPDDIAQSVQALAADIPDKDLSDDGREAEPHVTVKYGLHDDDPEAVRKAVEGFGPVRVRLGQTSLFVAAPGGEYDVVKVDVDSADLHRLNQRIADALPHTDTHPKYAPHLTLAYVKAGRGAKYADNDTLAGREFVATELVFSDREGLVTSLPLAGPCPPMDAPAACAPPMSSI